MSLVKWSVLLPLAGVVLLGFIVASLDWAVLSEVLSSLPFWMIGVVCVLWLVPVCWTAFEWWIILRRHGMHVGVGSCIRLVLLGYFFGFVTPGGVGAYARVLYLQRESGEPLEKCLANVVLLNTVDFVSLLVLSVGGALLVVDRFSYLLALSVGLLSVVVVLFVLFLRHDFLSGVLERVLRGRLSSILKGRIGSSEGVVFRSLPSLGDMVVPLCLSVVGWLVLFSLFYAISLVFGVSAPYGFVVLAMALASVVGTIPVTLYGLGTREAVLIALLSVFGASAEVVVALSLFWFVGIWLVPSVVGAVVSLVGGWSNVDEVKNL